MRPELKIEQALNELSRGLRPICPICGSTLFFTNGRWACQFCEYRHEGGDISAGSG